MSRDSTLADDDVEPGAPSSESRTDAGPDEAIAEPRRRGELLGRYVLLEPIGRGGMGVVYSAYDPELDRRIALKLLHADGSERANVRLLREAQAMAKLVHPNVITVHDVGRFDGGVFVAMELVEGGDLRDWLGATKRSPTEILEVFLAAGRGLLAAHEAGIVHRDFKPANVLVGRSGEVKVVDFGLARRVDDSLDSTGLRELAAELDVSTSISGHADDDGLGLTRTGALLGTPAYMSPEQHARRTLDARTDQFSFCVSLYEALFDQRPFEGHSRVALAVATNRGEIRALPRGTPVPGRISRAVQRGLSTKPRERFDSMAELLAELRHDPTRRRNQIVGAGVAAGLLVLGAYGYAREPEPVVCADPLPLIAETWSEPQHTELARIFGRSDLPYADDTARFVSQRLDGWSRSWADARQDACVRTRVRHEQPESALELQLACLERQRKDLAAVARLLLEADATTIERADELVASLPAPEACGDVEALGRRPPPPADATTRETVERIRAELSEIKALRAAGRYNEAMERARATRARAETTGYQPVLAELLLLLGNLHNHGGEQVRGEQLLHQAAQAAAEVRDDEVLARAWLELAWNLGMGQSRHDDGRRWAEYAESVVNRMGRPDWLRTDLLCTQGNLAWARREPEIALERFDACIELRRAADPDDPSIANTLSYIGNAQIDMGRADDAEASFRRGLAVAVAAHGPRHPLVGTLHNGLGVAHYYQQRFADAEQDYRRAYEIDREILGPDHPNLLFPLGNIANIRREKGELRPALSAMEDVEALVEAAFPPVHREVGTTQHNIAELYALLDDPEEALRRYDRALSVRTEVHGEDAPFVANTLTGRGEVLLTLGRDEDALRDLERALAIRGTEEHPRPLDAGRTRFALARALGRRGLDRERARRLVLRAREAYETANSPLLRQRREAMDAWLEAHPAEG